MTDIDDVAALLERWRDASGVGRLGVAVDATRIIRDLSPARKRDLAVEVASRVAPQLVPQIRAEEGDLTGEQVAAVVDLIRRADDAQLTELADALRGGDVDGALDLVDEAVDAVEPALPPVLADDEDRATGLDTRADDVLDDAVAALRAVEPAAPTGPQPAEEVIDEAAVRRAAEEAAAARAARWKDTSRLPDRPAYVLPEVSFDIDLGDLELPDPTVEEVAPLEHRRDVLPGAMATARPTTGRPTVEQDGVRDGLAASPTPVVVAALTATPDGYRRRRATLAAIRDGRLEHDDVAPVVASMARASDRAWVAGAALDVGLIRVGDLDRLSLSAEASRRLARRAPR